jgi:hypothetical protein
MPDETLHDDATTAFLFQCGNSDLFAVSHDQTGANIPTGECPERWQLRNTFRLGDPRASAGRDRPEPILRGIAANGYFIWRAGAMFGTSQ